MTLIRLHEEVRTALSDGRPVVALETAVLTHGLPAAMPVCPLPDGIGATSDALPFCARVVTAMQQQVRAAGAVPATVAVVDGALRVGLEAEELLRLAESPETRKIAASGLAAALAAGASGGTTVSATLVACGRAPGGPLRFFATGGIGGVHRDWTSHLDISADLRQLATTPTCIVCAGAKSILDLPATLEWLEMLGVPVVGFGTDRFPRFHAAGTDGLETPHRVDDVTTAAALCRIQWLELGLLSGVLLACDVPADFALPADELERCVATADDRANAAGVAGPARTPYLLETLTELTGGSALGANTALLLRNARVAGTVAGAFHGRLEGGPDTP